MNISSAIEQLSALLMHYHFRPNDDRGQFFRGLMAKTIDSLKAISSLQSVGAVWPIHCRWIVEAFAYASAVHNNSIVIEEMKRDSMKTFLLLSDIESNKREDLLKSICESKLVTVQAMLSSLSRSATAKHPDVLYKVYRMLCEYSHVEFYRTIAYPELGTESGKVLDDRREFFERAAIVCAASIPSFAHCPPNSGFDDDHYELCLTFCGSAWVSLDALVEKNSKGMKKDVTS